ncbi:MAG: type II secretion system protein M [Psychromonas sp.]|nr:type II secretion system protein M [Psychromonas sp.]
MVEQFKDWWMSLDLREKQLVGAAGVLVVIGFIYLSIWNPIITKLEKAKSKLHSAEKTLLWVENKSPLIINLGGGSIKPTKKIILSELMTETGNRFLIKFTRIVDKKQYVDVSVEDLDFNMLVAWLIYLKKNDAIVVQNIDLTKLKKPGYVKVNRLSLGYNKV